MAAKTPTIKPVGSKGLAFSENLEGNKVLENLRNQRASGKFCDIVLHVENKQLPAHRSILAASSPYFESILKNHRVLKEELAIDWNNVKSFEVMLDYMYSGAVTIDSKNIDELLKLANHFLLEKLKTYCEKYLEQFLSLDNCLETKELTERYGLLRLQEVVLQFISERISEVLMLPGILELSFENLENFITDPETRCDSLTIPTLLNMIASWVKHDIPERTKHLEALLGVINWKLGVPKDIFDHLDNDCLYQESVPCFQTILKVLSENGIKLRKDMAEVYDKLKSQNDGSAMSVVKVDELEEAEVVPPSPIHVEPIDENEGQNTRRSARTRRHATEVATPEPSTSSTARSTRGKRNIKPRFDAQEWVVEDEKPPTKKVRIETITASSSVRRPTRSSTSRTYSNANDDDGDTSDYTASNADDEEASRKALQKLSTLVEGVAEATLAQWKEGIKCPHCSYIGHSATRLEQHLARVHEEDQVYKCKQCDFECRWNREYYKHMKQHFGGPPYKCEDCDYTCDRIQFILSHRMRHTDERPFQCELCNFSSRTKGNLIVHMRIHTGEKPYRCQHCGRCFAMKNTLDQHLATHRDDRPFLCDSCGFSTKYQSHLLSHKRIHTGNVFPCTHDDCNYSSPRRSQLAAHMRSHLSIRSHICSTCGRAFIEKSHLIRHERIHLDEKPFKCDECEYGSTRRDKLKEHVLKHHSKDSDAKAAAANKSSSSYRPRRGRGRLATVGNGNASAAGDDGAIESHQLIITGDGDNLTHGYTEEQVATANLIYAEYTNEDGESQRVVIQPMGSEFPESHVVIEGQLTEENDDSSQGVVIQAYEEGDEVVTSTGNATRSRLVTFVTKQD